MMDPVTQAQEELAATLAESEWFHAHGVEIIQQNKAALKFLIDKQVATLGHVALIIGCDSMTNMQTGIEMVVTFTAIEYVPLNRANENFVSAIQAIEAVIDLVDGEWWHFDRLEHTTPADRVLEATATFRCVYNRVQENEGGQNGTD